LYFITAFSTIVKGKYSYGAKFNRTKAAKEIVLLPVTLTGTIDYAYMEERINELQEERINGLQAYLKKTYLANQHEAND